MSRVVLHLVCAVHVGAALIHNQLCLFCRQRLDGFHVEMVAVFVGHEEIVGLGHGGVVNHFVAKLGYRVNLNLLAVVLNAYAGMNERMELHGLSALGLEYIHLVGFCRHRLSGLLPGQDATLQVHALVTLGGQLFGGISRAAAAAAIDGNLLFCRNGSFDLCDEAVLPLVYIDGTINVTFGIFCGSTHIQ